MNPFHAFLNDSGDEPLYAPVPNFAPFLVGSCFNERQYFGKWYKTTQGSPLLLTAKQGKWIGWMVDSVFTNPSKEILADTLRGGIEAEQRRTRFEEIRKQMDKDYEHYTYQTLKQHTVPELQALIHTIFDTIWGTNAMAFFSFFLDKDLCQKVLTQEKASVDLEAIWERGTTSTTPSFETIDNWNIIEKRQKNLSREALLEYAQYTTCSYIQAGSLEEAETQHHHVLTSSLEPLIQEWELGQQEWREKHRAFEIWKQTRTPEEARLLDYLQTIIYLRDARKHLIRKGLTIIWRIGEILTEPLGIPKNILVFITREEITGDLTRLKCTELEARLNGFLYYVGKSGTIQSACVTNLDSIETALEERRFGKKDEQETVLQGQPASKGHITARARVILHPEEFKTFQPGEVLVTSMTRPEFVPLMKKAAAVVTDEGGVTCHAAIVSRELGIPCVIGTKKATRWVESGTLITVDGEKGTISKNP